VPIRIAFDLDGVFADMEGELARHAKTLFGERTIGQPDATAASATDAFASENAPSARSNASAEGEEPPLTRLRITARQQRRLWTHVESIENFWETLGEIEPGSVARLAALAEAHRWEIIFLTRRPTSAGATPQVQTQRWLESKGFRLPSVFVVQGSRGRIAAALALDIVVDDTPENCLDVVVDSKARSILVWRSDRQSPPPAAKRLGIGVVRSVDECLNILAQVEQSPAPGGIMERVKRLLGFKEATGV
jgi:hypothetical protein